MDAEKIILLGGISAIILGALLGYVFAWDILGSAIVFGFAYLLLAFVLGEFFLWYSARREYKRNQNTSALIGRYHFGIDLKGKRTGRVIMD